MNASDPPQTSLRSRLIGALLVLCGSALALWIAADTYDPGRLHPTGNFVDQAGHVLTSRVLADTGELRSGLIFPPKVDLPGWRLYMPGHYVLQALLFPSRGRPTISSSRRSPGAPPARS